MSRRDFCRQTTISAVGCTLPIVRGEEDQDKKDQKKDSTLPQANRVSITVLRRFKPEEVFAKMPVTIIGEEPKPCDIFKDGQKIMVEGTLDMPAGFCTVAWHTIFPSVRTLAFGGNLPWFKEKGVAINCCIDGLRPVVFKIERA